MADVGTEYVLLRQSVGNENQLRTREIDAMAVTGEPLLLALDQEGRKHLLIPLALGEIVTADTHSRGVWLTEIPLVVGGATKRFAALQCREVPLELVFERLVQDVVDRIEAGESTSSACHVALDEWRAMLRAGGNISREEIVGLIGELEVLRRIGQASPARALVAWTGPRKTIHDFVHQGFAIEAKGTSSVDGATVSIHGLDQLDPSEVESLHLAVVHCTEDPAAPSLDDRIRHLIADGFPRDELLRGIERSGYVFEAGTSQETQYRVRAVRLWQVAHDFPGLRRSAFPEDVTRGVTRVRYELALSSAPPPISEDASRRMLESWLTP